MSRHLSKSSAAADSGGGSGDAAPEPSGSDRPETFREEPGFAGGGPLPAEVQTDKPIEASSSLGVKLENLPREGYPGADARSRTTPPSKAALDDGGSR